MKETKNEIQTKRVKEILLRKGSITNHEAIIKFRIMRLAARIFDLRKTMSIKTIIQDDRTAKYMLIKKR